MIDSHDKTSLMAKIALIGPKGSGKSDFVATVYRSFPEERRGEISRIESQGENVYCLEIYPANLAKVDGKSIHFQLAAMVGDVESELTWQLLLEDADAILFFASSAAGSMDNNVDALQNLEENMAVLGISWPSIPVLFVYNDSDAKDVYTLEELNAKLNRTHAQACETMTKRGLGVFKVLKAAINYIYDNIKDNAEKDNKNDFQMTPENESKKGADVSGRKEDDVVTFKSPSGGNEDAELEYSDHGEVTSDHSKSKIGIFGRLGFRRKK